MEWASLHRSVFGNTLAQYLTAAGLLVAGVVIVRLLQAVALRQAERWAARTTTKIDDFLISSLRKALIPILYYGALYVVLRSLKLNPAVDHLVTGFGALLVMMSSVRFVLQGIQFGIFQMWLPGREDAGNLERQLKAVMPVLTLFIWLLGVVFLMDNLGFKVSTIVAGLGIGGVAMALASQAVLGDMFSYFAIMLDRPFELDDVISIGDLSGTVEHIGIKTTRIRSASGEELIFSNKDLTDSRVRNFKRMQIRRVTFKIGLTYTTAVDHLKRATALIEEIIARTPGARFDRAHFVSFGDSSLNVEAAYTVLSADYNRYLDIQQAINWSLKEAFEKEGIEFAFPTRTLHMISESASSSRTESSTRA